MFVYIHVHVCVCECVRVHETTVVHVSVLLEVWSLHVLPLYCRYVKGLRLLHEDFRDWIHSNRDNDKPVIPDEVLKQILGNVGSLVGLNSGLLNELEARMANW